MSMKIHAGLAYIGEPGPLLNYWGGGGGGGTCPLGRK